MCDAWLREFSAIPDVEITCGDIFTTRTGTIPPLSPIDVKADAIISPANSFGFMDGGIDAVYMYMFGPGLQTRLQSAIAELYGGELPIGNALVIPTLHKDIPYCISAPTMRIPMEVSSTVNAYLAFRAALRAVLAHNDAGLPPIRNVLCPGLGTAVGRMPVGRCARQMRVAYDRVLGDAKPTFNTLRAAAQDEYDLRA